MGAGVLRQLRKNRDGVGCRRALADDERLRRLGWGAAADVDSATTCAGNSAVRAKARDAALVGRDVKAGGDRRGRFGGSSRRGGLRGRSCVRAVSEPGLGGRAKQDREQTIDKMR